MFSKSHCLHHTTHILTFGVPGVLESCFRRDRLVVSLIDVGGQRSERNKWLSCFDNTNSVLFVVAISEYDQTLKEDETMNRMQDSLNLFGTITSSKWLIGKPVILFLNKILSHIEFYNLTPIFFFTACLI